MPNMQWDDSLSVSVPVIDEQHQTWIQKFNDICTAIESVQGPQRVAEALNFLGEYTRYHFGTEEKYMADYDYPDREAHMAQHAVLRKTLADLEQEYDEDGATHILADSVNTFVGNWLINHIRTTDMKLGAFLRDGGL